MKDLNAEFLSDSFPKTAETVPKGLHYFLKLVSTVLKISFNFLLRLEEIS